RGGRVEGDAVDAADAGELRVAVAEAAGLPGAAGRVGLGVPVEQRALAGEAGERDGAAEVVGHGEVRRLAADREQLRLLLPEHRASDQRAWRARGAGGSPAPEQGGAEPR